MDHVSAGSRPIARDPRQADGRKEAFSLRKLFQVARLPAEAQVSAIDQMARRSRLRRPLTWTQARDSSGAAGC